MIKKNIVKKLNKQMNIEFYSSVFYLQSSAWCSSKGLEGSYVFFKRHSEEEMQHMLRFFDYICDIHQQPIINNIIQPINCFDSLMDLCKKTYENEKIVSMKINNLCDYALLEKDYSTFEFLRWFVSEQIEEEKLFKSILNKLSLVNNDGNGIFLVDQELKELNKKI